MPAKVKKHTVAIAYNAPDMAMVRERSLMDAWPTMTDVSRPSVRSGTRAQAILHADGLVWVAGGGGGLLGSGNTGDAAQVRLVGAGTAAAGVGLGITAGVEGSGGIAAVDIGDGCGETACGSGSVGIAASKLLMNSSTVETGVLFIRALASRGSDSPTVRSITTSVTRDVMRCATSAPALTAS
jgi:hypothetical protein